MKPLLSRNCPVCGAGSSQAEPFIERRLDEKLMSSYSYASRKEPEYMCYNLVRCSGCDVIYANEMPSPDQIEHAYHEAAYDSKEEAIDAAKAYVEALMPFLSDLKDRSGVLEIGTGTGIFLQLLREKGFTDLVGIEPSQAAIDAADGEIRSVIRKGMFTESDYAPGSFALICCFMTLEHVTDPKVLMEACHRLLKPGGRMAVVVHDWRAWNNRILGAKAPIIDIEHLQLFSSRSTAELYRRSGFVEVSSRSFRNRYRLVYWNSLFPTPSALKRAIHSFLKLFGMGNFRLSMNVGNLMVVGRKKA